MQQCPRTLPGRCATLHSPSRLGAWPSPSIYIDPTGYKRRPGSRHIPCDGLTAARQPERLSMGPSPHKLHSRERPCGRRPQWPTHISARDTLPVLAGFDARRHTTFFPMPREDRRSLRASRLAALSRGKKRVSEVRDLVGPRVHGHLRWRFLLSLTAAHRRLGDETRRMHPPRPISTARLGPH